MHCDVPFHCYIYTLPLFSASHLDDLLNEGPCILIACLSELSEQPDYVVGGQLHVEDRFAVEVAYLFGYGAVEVGHRSLVFICPDL